MDWVRNRLRRLDSVHFKQWTSGRYIVRWRDQYAGVPIDAGYHALVDSGTMLDFVWRYKIFRTLKSAQQACEDHSAGLDPAELARRRKYEQKVTKRKLRKAKSKAKMAAALDVPVKKTRKPRSDKGKSRGHQPDSK